MSKYMGRVIGTVASYAAGELVNLNSTILTHHMARNLVKAVRELVKTDDGELFAGVVALVQAAKKTERRVTRLFKMIERRAAASTTIQGFLDDVQAELDE